MNPLSRAMKMVRLAKTKPVGQEPANQPPPPSELLQNVRSSTSTTSDETGPDCQKPANQPPPPSELLQSVRSSTSTTSDETLPYDSTLNDITLSELVVFNDVDNVLTNQRLNKSMLNCYLPPVKDSILNQGNLVANVSLGSLSDDFGLLDGAANVQGPVAAVGGIIPQDLEDNMDIVDLDKNKRDSIDTGCGQLLEWESADHSNEDGEDNLQLEKNLEGNSFSCTPAIECQEAPGSLCESTLVDRNTATDTTLGEQPPSDSSHDSRLQMLDAVVIGQISVETVGAKIPQDLEPDCIALIDRDNQGASRSIAVEGQRGVDGVEEQVQEPSNNGDNRMAQEVADESTPRSRKRKANKDNWKKNINKNKRAKGEAYIGRRYEKDSSKYSLAEKPAKLLGERCSCKTAGVKCREVTDETRQNIHQEVWAMSWPQRNVLIKSLVHRVPIGRHRVENSESSRSNTLKYHLNVGTGLVPVCKKMFLSTTGITQHLIRAQVCETQETNVQRPKAPGTSSNRVEIRAFLKSLPSIPSHYCRKSSSKKYIEPLFNSKAEVYLEYKKMVCREADYTII